MFIDSIASVNPKFRAYNAITHQLLTHDSLYDANSYEDPYTTSCIQETFFKDNKLSQRQVYYSFQICYSIIVTAQLNLNWSWCLT